MVGAPISYSGTQPQPPQLTTDTQKLDSSTVMTTSRYAVPASPYATPNATLSTILPYNGQPPYSGAPTNPSSYPPAGYPPNSAAPAPYPSSLGTPYPPNETPIYPPNSGPTYPPNTGPTYTLNLSTYPPNTAATYPPNPSSYPQNPTTYPPNPSTCSQNPTPYPPNPAASSPFSTYPPYLGAHPPTKYPPTDQTHVYPPPAGYPSTPYPPGTFTGTYPTPPPTGTYPHLHLQQSTQHGHTEYCYFVECGINLFFFRVKRKQKIVPLNKNQLFPAIYQDLIIDYSMSFKSM